MSFTSKQFTLWNATTRPLRGAEPRLSHKLLACWSAVVIGSVQQTNSTSTSPQSTWAMRSVSFGIGCVPRARFLQGYTAQHAWEFEHEPLYINYIPSTMSRMSRHIRASSTRHEFYLHCTLYVGCICPLNFPYIWAWPI